MPFVSKKQRSWMYAAEKRGDVPTKVLKKFEKATPKGKELPMRVKKAAEETKKKSLLKRLGDRLSESGRAARGRRNIIYRTQQDLKKKASAIQAEAFVEELIRVLRS